MMRGLSACGRSIEHASLFPCSANFTLSNTTQGQLRPEEMITAKIKSAGTVEKGLEELLDHRDQHCKIFLTDAQTS